MRESVLFPGITRQMKLARAAWVDKFQLDVVAYVLEMAIAPQFSRIRCGRTASLPHRSVVCAARRVRFNFVRRPPKYVDVAAIGSPAGNAGGKVLVGVCDSAIMLFFVGIFAKIGIRVPHLPEMFDELFAFFIGAEFRKCSTLVRCNDVGNARRSASRHNRNQVPWSFWFSAGAIADAFFDCCRWR